MIRLILTRDKLSNPVQNLKGNQRAKNSMKVSPILAILLALISLSLPACNRLNGQEEQPEEEHHKIVVTSPQAKDVIITQQYVCQIHSQRHINVCALVNGYLEDVLVKEGQAVKKGDVMFKIRPVLYKAKLDAELAEAKLAELEFKNTKKLFDEQVVSQNEVALHQAKLAKAQAKAKLAEAELNFTKVRAPFDGIVDRLEQRQGSLIKEGDVLTTLSDNSVMWVYFNVPEARYLEYMADLDQDKEEQKIELVLANGNNSSRPARSARSRPISTTRPGTSPSARISRTRTACCVTVRPATC